jgi:3D (Asp-Asp-Asp) domain-containing protein
MVGLIFILLFGGRDTVTATTYKLTKAENGPYGNHMASGYKVSYKNPGNSRVIAVSPDLLKKFPYHTEVLIENAGKLNGRYKVEDVMSSRWHKRIDILLNWKVKHDKFYNVIIKKYDSIKTSIDSSNHSTNRIRHLRTKKNHKTIRHYRKGVKKSKRRFAR